MCMYLHTKFQVFGVVLTIFRQLGGGGGEEGKEGEGIWPPTLQKKPLNSPPD